jgi:hypothetical protein
MANVPAEERLTSVTVTYAVLAISLRKSDPDPAMGALRLGNRRRNSAAVETERSS